MPTGVGPKQLGDARALFGRWVRERRCHRHFVGLARRNGSGLAEDGTKRRDHVRRLCHHGGALFDEAVAALAAWIERRARHREYFAALFECEPGRNQ